MDAAEFKKFKRRIAKINRKSVLRAMLQGGGLGPCEQVIINRRIAKLEREGEPILTIRLGAYD